MYQLLFIISSDLTYYSLTVQYKPPQQPYLYVRISILPHIIMHHIPHPDSMISTFMSTYDKYHTKSTVFS